MILFAADGGTESRDTTASESAALGEAASHAWAMAATCGVAGLVLMSLLLLMPARDAVQTVMLAVMTGLLFFGLGVSLYSIYDMGRASQAQPSSGAHACKYCGKRFSDRRVWRKHQQSCVEMEL